MLKKNKQDSGPNKQREFDAETIDDFVRRVTGGGKTAMTANFEEGRKRQRHVYNFMSNGDKNRYSNVILYNEGAVQLEKKNPGDSSYIHATKIKSKYGNYILAQGPMASTLLDWYRLIWQYRINVIVCLSPMDNTEDFTKYFEKEKKAKLTFKQFSIKTFAVREEGPLRMYELRIKGGDSAGTQRSLHVVHLRHWKLSRPIDSKELLTTIRSTWSLEQSTASVTESKDSMTLVHGSSGVRRTGTYVVAAMLCKQVREKSILSIVTAASSVRKYRYGVMRNKLMFATMLEAVLNFSAHQGLVDGKSSEFTLAVKIIRRALLNHKSKESDKDENEQEEQDDE